MGNEDLSEEVERLKEQQEQDRKQREQDRRVIAEQQAAIGKLSHQVRGVIGQAGLLKDEVINFRRKDEARDKVTQRLMDEGMPEPVQPQGGPPRPRSADS